MICHLDWIQNTLDIILTPQNHLDKLWFTFSEEVIVKFQYFFFFKDLQNIQHSIQKMNKFWSLSRYHIIAKTCHIYTADLSQISWISKTGNFVISYLLWA